MEIGNMKIFPASTVTLLLIVTVCEFGFLWNNIAAAEVIIGFNYPETGPYAKEGLDEKRGAELAVMEINKLGGILGEKIMLLYRDSKSQPELSKNNANELFDAGAKMIFGGSSSAVAAVVGEIAHERKKLFFATLTYSMDTTGKYGYRTTFRECYDSWMAAQALGGYLRQHFPNKKYFYITADYTWGWTTEAALRISTDTIDAGIHPGVKTPFPNATEVDFGKAILDAKIARPDVLVLVLFGDDFTQAIHLASQNDLMRKGIQLVVPNLTLAMAEGAGADAMDGVIGVVPWEWNVPNRYPSARGSNFVRKFAQAYGRYPSSAAASAYTILYEYKYAVERAHTFETNYVITALEGHRYLSMKDEQYWREFDHQSIQSVFLVKGKPRVEVFRDRLGLDYFNILDRFEGEDVAIPEDLWRWQRLMDGKSSQLD
jgi:branched-chain amino acid transport system substrate-binding protein